MKKIKPLCEYSKRGIGKALQCTLDNNQGCKFVRYCSQDSMWWNSNNFISCERREQEMSKKNRKRFLNKKIEIMDSINNSVDMLDDSINIDIDNTIEHNEIISNNNIIVDEEELKIKKNIDVSNKRGSRRRILY